MLRDELDFLSRAFGKIMIGIQQEEELKTVFFKQADVFLTTCGLINHGFSQKSVLSGPIFSASLQDWVELSIHS